MTPCAYCDTYGPFVRDEQYVRDLHRLTHEVSRTYQRMFGPLIDAMHTIGKAAQDATATMLDLPHEDPVNALIIQPGDDITLTNALGTVDGRVTRIDLTRTPAVVIYLDGRWDGYVVDNQRDTWTVTRHEPAIPELRHGVLYDVTTYDGKDMRLYWSPIDGIRANHPWLHADGTTRTRRDVVVRARAAQVNP